MAMKKREKILAGVVGGLLVLLLGRVLLSSGSDAPAVNDPETMQARMEANFEAAGYHLAIPGRILEAGPDELAQLLARGRTGQLWQEESEA